MLGGCHRGRGRLLGQGLHLGRQGGLAIGEVLGLLSHLRDPLAGLLATCLLTTRLFAAGLLTAGLFATGLLATGLFATGLFAAGLLATCLLTTGLFATGLFATGLLAERLGQLAEFPCRAGSALGGSGDVAGKLLRGRLGIVGGLFAHGGGLAADRGDVLGQLGGLAGDLGLFGLETGHLAVRESLSEFIPLGQEFFGPLADVSLAVGQLAGLLALLR